MVTTPASTPAGKKVPIWGVGTREMVGDCEPKGFYGANFCIDRIGPNALNKGAIGFIVRNFEHLLIYRAQRENLIVAFKKSVTSMSTEVSLRIDLMSKEATIGSALEFLQP